jgi:hypothetical protein
MYLNSVGKCATLSFDSSSILSSNLRSENKRYKGGGGVSSETGEEFCEGIS